MSAIRLVTSGTVTIQILHERHENNFAIALLNLASVLEKLIASYSGIWFQILTEKVKIDFQGYRMTVRVPRSLVRYLNGVFESKSEQWYKKSV